MAIGFPQLDEGEGTVASYYGPALMAIEKDEKWELVGTRDAAVERDALVSNSSFLAATHARMFG